MSSTNDRGSTAAPAADQRCEPTPDEASPIAGDTPPLGAPQSDSADPPQSDSADAPQSDPVEAPQSDRAASGEDDFAALLAASEKEQPAQTRVQPGDVVRGRVVAIGPATAFVAIGAKAEAVIDLAEFRDPTTGELGLAV